MARRYATPPSPVVTWHWRIQTTFDSVAAGTPVMVDHPRPFSLRLDDGEHESHPIGFGRYGVDLGPLRRPVLDHPFANHRPPTQQGARDLMTDDTQSPDEAVSLADHLTTLADDASGLSSLLNAEHSAEGDIHPEALAKAAKLETSLREVIKALTHHEHLAMGADDIWKALSVDHSKREIMPD